MVEDDDEVLPSKEQNPFLISQIFLLLPIYIRWIKQDRQ